MTKLKFSGFARLTVVLTVGWLLFCAFRVLGEWRRAESFLDPGRRHPVPSFSFLAYSDGSGVVYNPSEVIRFAADNAARGTKLFWDIGLQRVVLWDEVLWFALVPLIALWFIAASLWWLDQANNRASSQKH